MLKLVIPDKIYLEAENDEDKYVECKIDHQCNCSIRTKKKLKSMTGVPRVYKILTN